MSSPTAFLARADTLSESLRDLAETASRDVVERLAGRVEDAGRTLTALWIREFGDLDSGPADPIEALAFARSAAPTLVSALDVAVVDPGPLAQAWLAAYSLGVDHAVVTAPSLPDPLPARDQAPPFLLGRAVAEQAQKAAQSLSAPAVTAQGYSAVTSALVKARHAVTRLDATVQYEVTAAASAGVRDVARQTGAGLIWVAERDGCLHCLAYSGATTLSETFPQGLTFADKPPALVPALAGPPLHPRCRCTLECWDPADDAVAAALKREAKRSVLRGDSVDGEPARLRAAERLLERGAGLPKTVEDRARASVRRGAFTTRKARPRGPDPDPAPAAAERPARELPGTPRAAPRDMTDDELDAAMAAAIDADDFDLVDAITEELDRRDAAGSPPPDVLEHVPADDWATAWGHGLDEGDDEPTDPEEAARLDRMAELVEQGFTESEAYGVAYGVSSDRYARDEAIRVLRQQYSGAGFDDLARQSYRDHIYQQWLDAEDVTRGVLLNKAGKAAKVDPFSLFSGPLARPAKYASDELKDWWEENGRVTFDEWKAQLLGDGGAQRAARYSGSGRRFDR